MMAYSCPPGVEIGAKTKAKCEIPLDSDSHPRFPPCDEATDIEDIRELLAAYFSRLFMEYVSALLEFLHSH